MMATPPEHSPPLHRVPDLSIEVVPRSLDQLAQECRALKDRFPSINTANIPDLLRMPLRSWDACRAIKPYFSRVIPHLRAIDFNLSAHATVAEAVDGFEEVLVISGDPPKDFSRVSHDTRSVDLIGFLKREFPCLRIHAGIDPYRQGPRAELDYLKRKLDAGAEAFFTQPFFSIPLFDTYRELLTGYKIYWGISPVLSTNAHSYWEVTNRAVFAPGFLPTLSFNQAFARAVLARLETEATTRAYFMPIRTDAIAYLEGVLDHTENK